MAEDGKYLPPRPVVTQVQSAPMATFRIMNRNNGVDNRMVLGPSSS